MQASELRIGNFVNDRYDFLIQVDSVDDVGINIYATDDGDVAKPYSGELPILGYEQKLENLQPIPLTEEWLLKFGAKLFPWGWVLNEFLIAWNRKGAFWIEVGNGKRIDLPYVHTIQNFFALTGEELTIKQPA